MLLAKPQPCCESALSRNFQDVYLFILVVAAESWCVRSYKRITEGSLLYEAQASFRLAFPCLNTRCSEDVLGTDGQTNCRFWATRMG